MTVRPVLEADDDCSIHGLDPRLQLTPLPSLLQSASDFRNLDQLTTDQAGLASPECGLGRHLAPVTICGVRYPQLSGEIANNIPDHQIMQRLHLDVPIIATF